MLIYRTCKEKHAKKLDGEGAKLYGGRWNSIGNAVVYCASSRSLAILETLVNVGDVKLIPDNYVMLELLVPDNLLIETITLEDLPKGFPEEKILQIGNKWITECASPILIVPSKVVNQENNVLINPNHPLSNKITLNAQTSFHKLDSRLFNLK